MLSIKTKIATLITLCLTMHIQAQAYLTWNEVETQKFGKEVIFKTKSDNKPLQGGYKISETSGAYADLSFKNGKIEGEYSTYDFDGRIESVATYIGGKINGKSISYYQNGDVASEYYYKNNEPDGTWKDYNKKGKIRATQNYKNGKKEGKWTRILKNPAKNTTAIVTEFYRNDEPFGHWEQRLDDGKLNWEQDYTSGVDYIKKTYYPNGKLAEELTIKNRRKNGITKNYTQEGILLYKIEYDNDHVIFQEAYYDNGQLKSSTHYKYGAINGPFVFYNEDGVKTIEGKHKDTYKDGIWKKFDEKKGRLLRETTYKNDVKNGLCKHYNKAKKVSLEGLYSNGEKDGIWKCYNLAGDLTKEIEYRKGKEISTKKYN